jgi:large subunit ribosomal protein L14
MIQVGTFLNFIDNSGEKEACCIKIVKGYRKRYAFVGDLLFVSVKSLRSKRKSTSKVKKGEVCLAVVLRTKSNLKSFSGDRLNFFENSVVLLNRQYKFIGTRVFGALPKQIRYTKYLRVVSLSSGLVN